MRRVDFWDDQSDVYRISLRKGQKLFAVLSGPKGTDTVLALWKPETGTWTTCARQGLRIRHSARAGFVEQSSRTGRLGPGSTTSR